MRTSTLFVSVIAVCAALFHTPTVSAEDQTVSYPGGYRNWTFLHGSIVPGAFGAFSKLPCVKPCTNGMFYFYANELAMKGLRTGAYEDGAIIAEEMLEFKIGEKGVGGEGRRVLTAVMVMDRSRFASTAGWGFGNYDEGSKVNTLDAKAQRACFQCHISQKDNGYVFTRYVDR